MIKPHFQYLWYVLRHKWYVLVAGLKLDVPLWQLIVHDSSKFSSIEWSPYVNRFYGPKAPVLGSTGYMHKSGDDLAFDRAWEHHWRNNPHHWNYWLDDDKNPQEMPEVLIREMVADWRSAGLTQGKPDLRGWYAANKDNLILAPRTRILAERFIERVLS